MLKFVSRHHRAILILLLGSETLLIFPSPRSCRVQIEFPKIEVRYEDVTVDAYVHVGSRALPTIPNFICNMTEVGPKILTANFSSIYVFHHIGCSKLDLHVKVTFKQVFHGSGRITASVLLL